MRPLVIALSCAALLLGSCSDAPSARNLGDTCYADDECSSGRCDELVCKSASPAGADAPCDHPLECRSEQCGLTADRGGRCTAGVRETGSPCTDDLQCADGRCEAGLCAPARGDGGVPDLDAGADTADTTGDGRAADLPMPRDALDEDGGQALLFTLQTTALAPESFDPTVAKIGLAPRWDLGDGTIVEAVAVDHSYSLTGTKTVRVYTFDGGAGLIALDASNDALSGTIPAELGELPNLTEILLQGNQLTGSIPPELGQAFSLVQLNLSGNQLTGSIPAELGQIFNLTEVSLDGNELSGSIPPALGQLVKLTNLSAHSNQLTGNIPAELGQLSRLTKLALWANQLTGSIPAELGQLTGLTELSLQANQLSGIIPPELGQLVEVTLLALSVNELTGSIPPQLGQLSKLTNLALHTNQLTGTIPAELGQLTDLQLLWLQSNQLTSYTRGAFSGLKSIVRIDVSDNLLDQAAVDALIDDIYQDRSLHTSVSNKTLLVGGTNAAPSAAAQAQIDTLRAGHGWTISCNGC